MAVSEKSKRAGIFNENLRKYFGAEEGAFSILTGPEIEKKTINVKKAMRDLLIRFLGEDNIPRITDEDDQTVRFEICSNGEINTGEYCAVPCKFSKPGKNEMTMYLNSRWIHTELEPGDCWYIWIRNQASLPVLGVIKAEKWKKIISGQSVRDAELSFRFEVDQNQAYRMFNENAEFREEIEKGIYTYIEPYLVVRSPEYVTVSENGNYRLEESAWQDLKSCCISFGFSVPKRPYESSAIIHFIAPSCSVGPKVYGHEKREDMNRDQRLFNEQVEDEIKMFRKLPNDYADSLKLLKEWRKTTYKEIAENTGLNVDVVGRTIRGKGTHDKYTIVKICFFLQLPTPIFLHVLNNAPNRLDLHNNKDMVIFATICYYGGQPYLKIMEILKNSGVYI